MGTMASQITSLTIVYSTVYSSADQRKHQSSVSLAFVRGIHRGPVNFPHKLPVTRKIFPSDDAIMKMRIILPWTPYYPIKTTTMRIIYAYNNWRTLFTIMFCSALWIEIKCLQMGFWTKFPQKYKVRSPCRRHLSRALSVKLIRIARYKLWMMSSSGIWSAMKLTNWGRGKMGAISQTTCWSAFERNF